MAIHPRCPGLSASILVARQPLQEYNDDSAVEDDTTVTKYIEAHVGGVFEVKFEFAAPFPIKDDVSVTCYMDGTKVTGAVISKRKLYGPSGYHFNGTHEKEGRFWVRKSICFGNLAIDRRSFHTTADINRAAQIGTIKLSFEYCSSRKSSKVARPSSLAQHAAIPANALQGDAKSLQVVSGTSQRSKSRGSRYWKTKTGLPFAEFIFKYRTRADLEALRVISFPNYGLQARIPARITRSDHHGVTLSQRPSSVNSSGGNGLAKQDLLILLKHYRGTTTGMEELPAKDLEILLNSYRNQEHSHTTASHEQNEYSSSGRSYNKRPYNFNDHVSLARKRRG